MATLYLTPPGTRIDHCVSGFLEVLQKDPLDSTLILPSSRLVTHIQGLLTGYAVSIRKDAISTPGRFAEEILRKFAPDLCLLSDLEGRQLLQKIVSENQAELKWPDDVVSGRVSDLYTLFSEVRVFRDDDTLPQWVDSQKIREISQIYRVYRAVLRDRRLVDRASVVTTATGFVTRAKNTLFVFGIANPRPDIRRFFAECARSARSFTYYHPFRDSSRVFPDTADWLCADTVVTLPAPREKEVFSTLFSPGMAARPPGVPVFTHGFSSHKEELEAVAEEITHLLCHGCSCRDILIAAPDLAATTLLMNEIFPAFGLPFTSSATFSLSRSPVIQGIVQVLELPVRHFQRQDVITAVSHPLQRNLFTGTDLTPGELDRISRDALIREGRDSWISRLAALEKNLQEVSSSEESPDFQKNKAHDDLIRVQDASLIIGRLLSHLTGLDQTTDIQGHISRVRQTLSSLDLATSDLSVAARRDLAVFTLLLDEWERASLLPPGDTLSYNRFIASLKAEVRDRETQGFQTGYGIRVAGLREIQGESVPVLFLVDLCDTRLPYIPSLLPFLSSAEEHVLDPGRKERNLQDERFYFISALCTGDRRIYASAQSTPCKDGQIASPFFRELKQVILCREWIPQEPVHSLSFRQVSAGIALGNNHLPGAVLQKELSATHDMDSLVARINAEYYHRTGGYDSPYDGVLVPGGQSFWLLAERYNPARVFSASFFEGYARCPFQFYITKVLGLDALPEIEVTMTPRDRGERIHAILSRFYTEWREAHERPPGPENRDEARDLLVRITGQVMEEYPKEGPLWDAFMSDLLGMGGYHEGVLEKFLDIECIREQSPLVPAWFECSFGFPGARNSLSDTPVRIPVSGQDGSVIRLHGVIDRVDISSDGEFSITDYKTGKTPGLKEILDGTSFQLPLYLRAFEILTGRTGIAGAYYSLGRGSVYHKAEIYAQGHPAIKDSFTKQSQGCSEPMDEILDRSVALASGVLDSIRSGRFPPPEGPCPAPDYCPARRICRFDQLRSLSVREPEREDENAD